MRFQQNHLWIRSPLAAVFVSPLKPRSPAAGRARNTNIAAAKPLDEEERLPSKVDQSLYCACRTCEITFSRFYPLPDFVEPMKTKLAVPCGPERFYEKANSRVSRTKRI